MKCSKTIKLIVLIILSLSVFFIYNLTNYNNISYTVIGDGLSCGIDSYGIKGHGYSDYIKDYLKNNKKLQNYSKEYTKEGITIEMLYNDIISNQKMLQNNTKQNITNILSNTDYLTITIGLNDLLYKIQLLDQQTEENLNVIIKEIETDFNNLIKTIRTIYKKDIYIVGYYDFDIKNEFYKKAIRKLNNIYINNKDVIYISTYILSENKSVFFSNPQSYYPNYKGYQLISTKIIDKISKKLEK